MNFRAQFQISLFSCGTVYIDVLMALYKELSVCSCQIIDSQPVMPRHITPGGTQQVAETHLIQTTVLEEVGKLWQGQEKSLHHHHHHHVTPCNQEAPRTCKGDRTGHKSQQTHHWMTLRLYVSKGRISTHIYKVRLRSLVDKYWCVCVCVCVC